MRSFDNRFESLLLSRMLEANEIWINNENELVVKGHNGFSLPTRYSMASSAPSVSGVLLCPIDNNNYWNGFDMVSVTGQVMILP